MSSWLERRDAVKGYRARRDWHKKPAGSWLEVSAGTCGPPCHCDGFEVVLYSVEVNEKGGGSSNAVFPAFSVRSKEEARAFATSLRSFVRSWLKRPTETDDPWIYLDWALKDWAKREGFQPRTKQLWAKEK